VSQLIYAADDLGSGHSGNLSVIRNLSCKVDNLRSSYPAKSTVVGQLICAMLTIVGQVAACKNACAHRNLLQWGYDFGSRGSGCTKESLVSGSGPNNACKKKVSGADLDDLEGNDRLVLARYGSSMLRILRVSAKRWQTLQFRALWRDRVSGFETGLRIPLEEEGFLGP